MDHSVYLSSKIGPGERPQQGFSLEQIFGAKKNGLIFDDEFRLLADQLRAKTRQDLHDLEESDQKGRNRSASK